MKRKRPSRAANCAKKKQKLHEQWSERPSHALLAKYYPEIVTLRQYLASRLPKKRRRTLQQYGRDVVSTCDSKVVGLLDFTLVGCFKHVEVDDSSFVDDDIALYTQQLSEIDTTASRTPGKFKQSEIVDFVVWLLFRRQVGNLRPQHLLCQNYQRYVPDDDGLEPEIVPCIPGVFSNGPHENVNTLKAPPWSAVPDLLGRGAERVLGDLLLECGLFAPVDSSSNIVQICGVPVSDLPVISSYEYKPESISASHSKADAGKRHHAKRAKRGLAEIRFVRHRMLYARPILNANGAVRCGLHQIHALNQYRDSEDRRETQHIMKYMFPLQFGLHNVLESDADRKDTAQVFKDYTIREQEISKANGKSRQKRHTDSQDDGKLPLALPKRLRGAAEDLVGRLRKRHGRCAYSALLDHYCPKRASSPSAKHRYFLHQAASMAQVSSFCRAVTMKVFPKDFWGSGENGKQNTQTLLRNIDRFIRVRRYETISLHDVLQSMNLDVDWLVPLKQDKNTRMSTSDFSKRKELMAEVLYYLFDSFLIPLIRSHFHVTESNVQRNQLFYFRHDVWKELSEPAMESLKSNMLEERSARSLANTTVKRQLGVSHVRLVPKETGMRPIINLRRRVQKVQNGQVVLGRSINSLLTPIFSVLNYGKGRCSHDLGSALFSVDDIYPRLQAYRLSLEQQGLLNTPLYFAKVDVQACFDTIPQKRLMELARRILGHDEYQISRYSRAKLLGSHNKDTPGFGAKPSWKFLTKASPVSESFDFQKEVATDVLEGRRRALYVNGLAPRLESRTALLSILEEHVESNMIQIGKRLYRQKKGIPQGSIVSSLLCSYFYADMERQLLAFLNNGSSTTLRLIDDFLVISTDRRVAEKFMRLMHAGIPEYGIQVKLEKSRANFELDFGGRAIPLLGAENFPYCGTAINTRTLDLSKDNERRQQTNLADSVAVEYSKVPGQTFYRKLLNALKLQMRAMLLSTSYNSIDTVLSNIYHSFVEVAQKSYYYIKSLPRIKQPPGRLAIKAVDDMINLAYVLAKRRKSTSKDVMPYECCVTSAQARWLACTAFVKVFQRRQTRHQVLHSWLRAQLALPAIRAQKRRLEPVVSK